jgi:CRP-like cAMP-binding protein
MTEPSTTDARLAALHAIDLFAGASDDALRTVAEAATEQRFDKGEELIAKGAIEDHLFAIMEGRVRVERPSRKVAEFGPGSTVGEMAVLVPEARSASVVALEPTLVLSVSKPAVDELLRSEPDLVNSVIRALVARLNASANYIGAGDFMG